MKKKIVAALLAVGMTASIGVSVVATETKVYEETQTEELLTNENTASMSIDTHSKNGQFQDISENDYYYKEVLWGTEKGIVSGLFRTEFGPTVSCSRGQIATFLWRAQGKQIVDTVNVSFTDVAPSAYYYDAVAWAVEQGIISGYNEKTFAPEDICTRAQLVTILHRLAGTPKPANNKMQFMDVSEAAYYYDAVAWAVEQKIANGYSVNTFGSDDKILRCDTVKLLYGYYQLMDLEEDPEVTQEVTPTVEPEITPTKTPEDTSDDKDSDKKEESENDKDVSDNDTETESELSEVDKAFPWNKELANEVVEVARTYLAHSKNFRYKAGYGVFDNTYIDKTDGKGLIDCSTFVGLVLRGIPYENSRYVTNNIWDNMAKTSLYGWADSGLDRDHVRWAYQYADYYIEEERTFEDLNSLKPADLMLHYKKDAITGEESVWHVSMVLEIEEDGDVICIHSLYGKETEGILTFPLKNWALEKLGRAVGVRPDYARIDKDVIEYYIYPWAIQNINETER